MQHISIRIINEEHALNEKLAAKYQNKRAYLTVNRLQQDGTLTNG